MKSYEARRQEKWNAVANQTTDAQRAIQRRKEAEARGLIDPGCRFARWDATHVCSNRGNEPLRPFSTCFMEATAQMREAAELEREAAQRNLAPLPPYEPPPGLPRYEWRKP